MVHLRGFIMISFFSKALDQAHSSQRKDGFMTTFTHLQWQLNQCEGDIFEQRIYCKNFIFNSLFSYFPEVSFLEK